MIELSTHVIVQRAEVTEQKDLTSFMNTLANTGKKILVVDSYTRFFSVKNLFASMDSGDFESLGIIVEKNDIDMSSHDWSLIRAYNDLRDKLNLALKPKYEFKEVPSNWSIETSFKINKTTMTRAGHTIGIKTAKKVWDQVSKHWFDNKEKTQIVIRDLSIANYYRDVTATPSEVKIGCQTIDRYEIEQLAIHMNWDFPS